MMVIGYLLLVQAYLREAARPYVWSLNSAIQAALPIGLVLTNTVLMFTALYLYATPVGGTLLTPQGRYFLPLAAVPLISLFILSARPPRPPSVVALAPFILLIQAGLVLKVLALFY